VLQKKQAMSSKRVPKPVRSHHLIALALLLAFFAQCAWFVYSVPLTQPEADQIVRGVALLRHISFQDEAAASPMVPLFSIAGVIYHLPQSPLLLDQFWLDQHRWFIRAPFLFAGLGLGFSLWFVARRLYGGAGGNVALALYAFSPGLVACSSLAGPQIFAAWGSFGMIFTAIATAHTLYAPREVILWNWKRIALLGTAIALALGAQWTLACLLLPASVFMLWAVPHRRKAAMLILAAAVMVSLVLLDVFYLGDLRALAHGLAAGASLSFTPQLLAPGLLARIVLRFFLDSVPGAMLALVVALVAWCCWRRTRFFGNTAPLIVFAMLLLVGIFFPENGVRTVLFASLPFLLEFVAGVFADLIESKYQAPALAVIFAIIAAQAAYSVASLIRMYSRLPGS
jgi:hypothetical protein